MVVLLALGGAVAFAFSHIFTRVGLKYAPPTTAMALSIPTATILVWGSMLPLVSSHELKIGGVAWFMMTGMVAPWGTQFLLFSSALRVGLSRAAPLRNTSPLFSSLLAITFLGERWTLSLAFGTLSIMAGATLLGMQDKSSGGRFKRIYLLLPLAAGLLGGFADPLRKIGFQSINSPPVFLCSALGGSSLAMICYLVISGKYRELVINRNTLKWFCLTGASTALGASANLMAISRGDVVLVTPLISTVPLFTILLSALLLRRLESVTPRIAFGAVWICLGAILLTAF